MVHFTHALTLHACAVVELRFVTERKRRKKKKTKLCLGRFLRKARVINKHMVFQTSNFVKCWSQRDLPVFL